MVYNFNNDKEWLVRIIFLLFILDFEILYGYNCYLEIVGYFFFFFWVSCNFLGYWDDVCDIWSNRFIFM